MSLLKDIFLNLHPSWQKVFTSDIKAPYLKNLSDFLEQELKNGEIIFPKQQDIFSAFNQTPFNKVKVLLLGQDPYHGPGQAHGLSFSVPQGVSLPPSLKNIFKEISSDIGVSQIPTSGDLSYWAKQGVLLLNTTLTVRQKTPLSHSGKGWELFTDKAIEALCKRGEPIVFLLWGRCAKSKEPIIKEKCTGPHLILSAAHPSPFSAHSGFFGCSHFSQANKWLVSNGLKPIDWIF